MNWHDRKMRDGAADWLSSMLARHSDLTFVTLTLKQGRQRADGSWERITRTIAQAQLKWFLRELDRAVFGKAAIRHGTILSRFPVFEGGDSAKRLHMHMLVETPTDRMTPEEFKSLIAAIWLKTNWGHGIVHVEQSRKYARVIRYMLKTGLDALDAENAFIRPLSPSRHSALLGIQKTLCGI